MIPLVPSSHVPVTITIEIIETRGREGTESSVEQWRQTPRLPLAGLGKSFPFSGPWFPHLYRGRLALRVFETLSCLLCGILGQEAQLLLDISFVPLVSSYP